MEEVCEGPEMDPRCPSFDRTENLRPHVVARVSPSGRSANLPTLSSVCFSFFLIDFLVKNVPNVSPVSLQFPFGSIIPLDFKLHSLEVGVLMVPRITLKNSKFLDFERKTIPLPIPSGKSESTCSI